MAIANPSFSPSPQADVTAVQDRLRRHFEAVDPDGARRRVSLQGGGAAVLALGILWTTAFWPSVAIWTGLLVLLTHVAIVSDPGGLVHELKSAIAVILSHSAALSIGALAHSGTIWFLPAVAAVGFAGGLGAGVGIVGRCVGATAFIAFAVGATSVALPAHLIAWLSGGGIAGGASLLVLVVSHLAFRPSSDRHAQPERGSLARILWFDRRVLWHALRFALTALSATVVANLLGVAHPIWVMLTIAVVLQRRLGATLLRSAQRFAGTVAGAVLGWGIVVLVGPEHEIWLLVALPAVLFAVFLYTPGNYAVAIGFVTAAVIFVHVLLGEALDASALERLADTIVAIVIGIAVSFVLVPERVVDAARDALVAFLETAARQYPARVEAALGRDAESDEDDNARVFLEHARLAEREVALAQWEAMPGRRVAGIRRRIRRCVLELHGAIVAVGTPAANISPDISAADKLRQEAAQIVALLGDLATAIGARRSPDDVAFQRARDLLSSAHAETLPFKEQRLVLLAALADLQELQRRRFPGAERAVF